MELNVFVYPRVLRWDFTTLAIKPALDNASLKNRAASVAESGPRRRSNGSWRWESGVFWSVCSINSAPAEGSRGEEGGGRTSRLRALADDQCLGFIFAISERGGGSCLIKSRLFYFTQEDLITFYVGVLDCLIITTFLATHPPNQLLRAAPSLLDWFVTVTANPDDGAPS